MVVVTSILFTICANQGSANVPTQFYVVSLGTDPEPAIYVTVKYARIICLVVCVDGVCNALKGHDD